MSQDSNGGCPECGSLKLKATANVTECKTCGHRFQSGLQSLARRFI